MQTGFVVNSNWKRCRLYLSQDKNIEIADLAGDLLDRTVDLLQRTSTQRAFDALSIQQTLGAR